MNYRFAAYEALIQLREVVERYPNSELEKEIHELIDQVQNRKYIVAVAGEFNRGKSSLINALLGMPILPMDILPMTATVNRIVYGLTPRVIVHKKDGSEQQIKVNELAEYVTKQTEESSQMAKTIRETIIEYPTILCQNGLEILDTPGLNDTDEMSHITRTILQEAHAVVFAVSALMPLSMTEVDWLAGMIESERLQYLMFAVTFFDRVSKRDREKVLNTIRERISSMVQSRVLERYPDRPDLLKKAKDLTDPNTMFLVPVSSRDALDSFDLGDDELLQSSNIPHLKLELNTALNAQQDEYVLKRTAILLRQIGAWMMEANTKRTDLAKAQDTERKYDEALKSLQDYIRLTKEKMNEIYEWLAVSADASPNVYSKMRNAAKDVIQKKQNSIATNDDVHRVLREATIAAKEAAGIFYRNEWREHFQSAFNEYLKEIQDAHEALFQQCSDLLEDVPQLQETQMLVKKTWGKIGPKMMPQLPDTWSLDITGGLLKEVVSGSQQLVEGLGKAMGEASDFMEKRSSGFRLMKGKIGELIQKSGIAEKVEAIDLSKLEVKEGQLTNRNLQAEIDPMISQGTTCLKEQWNALPKTLCPLIMQVYLNEEKLTTDTALQMALINRKGKAEEKTSQLKRDFDENFESAQRCIDKAAAILKSCN